MREPHTDLYFRADPMLTARSMYSFSVVVLLIGCAGQAQRPPVVEVQERPAPMSTPPPSEIAAKPSVPADAGTAATADAATETRVEMSEAQEPSPPPPPPGTHSCRCDVLGFESDGPPKGDRKSVV